MARSVAAHLLELQEREEALAYLAVEDRGNLFLMDLVARFGSAPASGEAHVEIAVVRRAGELVGVAALRPSLVLDVRIELEALEALFPLIEQIRVGLVKSPAPLVDALWTHLSREGGRRAIVDRHEVSYVLDRGAARFAAVSPEWASRPASSGDLESLVYAARESLREEDRPDPFAGDAGSFRRWVHARVDRARVIESEGRVAFVGYADVQRSEGWLLQGIYTWPHERRRGLASVGTADLCREAFARGGEHVQLSVVEGNGPARALYEGLGFVPFARLRTLLFV